MLKVKIEKRTCLGCGGCIIICPEVFEYSEDIKSQIKKKFREKSKDPNIGLIREIEIIRQIRQIESLCPTYSIKAEEIT